MDIDPPPRVAIPERQPQPFEPKVYDLTDGTDEKSPTGENTLRSVLLLDDDPDLAKMLSDFLSAEGYEVTCAPNGVEGMKSIMAKDFAVIICDLLMPNLAGDMFYLAATKVKPGLARRFIFVSGHQANPKWEAFIRSTKAPVLWKPFPSHDLLTCVEAVAHRPGS
jgi:DNA-binding response OmpR family regulator